MTTLTTILAGSWSSALYGLFLLFRGTSKAASENPEKAAGVGNFIVALVIYAIIAAAIGGIAAAIAKLVFEADKEDTTNTFFSVGVIILIICVICYFVA